MRIIKLGLISLVGLSLVIFLLSALIPSEMRVSRAITIDIPKDSVVGKVKDITQWQQWNVLVNKAELTNKVFTSNRFASTELTVAITGTDSSLIQTQWTRSGQPPIACGINVLAADNRTIVQWYFDFKVKWYPWEKFGSIIFDNQLGPPMEQSLAQLKKLAEQHP
jgi:hypothetical protein